MVALRLLAGVHRQHATALIERDAVRNHLSLRQRRAQPPGRGDQHFSLRRPTEAAPGGVRLNQRLDQNRHRGSGRRQAVRLHVAARARGPQGRPAGAYRGEEFGLVAQAQKALELPGETRILAVLDERRGADGDEGRLRALRPPRVDERLDDRRRDRPLIEREPDLHRQPEAGRKVRRFIGGNLVFDAKMAQLMTIRGRRQREAARRRQAGARETGEIGGFAADLMGADGRGLAELYDEIRHRQTTTEAISHDLRSRG